MSVFFFVSNYFFSSRFLAILIIKLIMTNLVRLTQIVITIISIIIMTIHLEDSKDFSIVHIISILMRKIHVRILKKQLTSDYTKRPYFQIVIKSHFSFIHSRTFVLLALKLSHSGMSLNKS